MQKHRILIVNNFSWSWWMSIHWNFFVNQLLLYKEDFEIDTLNENNWAVLPQDVIETYSVVIRYSWYQWEYQTFKNADFTKNTSKDPSKNLLIIFSDATLYYPSSIQSINKHFKTIWADSVFCKEQAVKAWIKKIDFILPVWINTNLIKSKLSTTNIFNDVYKFLHISWRNMHYIKWLDCILDSFITEFTSRENVKLTIVTWDKSKNDTSIDIIDKYSDIFWKLWRLHQIEFIEKKLSHDETFDLYANHNCYVNSSRLETFSCPTLEAACMWLKIIMPWNQWMQEYEAMLDYDKINSTLVKMPTGVRRDNNESYWYEPDLDCLRSLLRKVFSNNEKWNINSINIIKNMYCQNSLWILAINNLRKLLFQNV